MLVILSFLASCKKKATNEQKNSETERSAYNILYDRDSCLDWTNKTMPVLKLASDTIYQTSIVEGKAFFSSNYLRNLAKCNNLDYKLTFSLYNSKDKPYVYQAVQDSDTINISLPVDSLKLMGSTKYFDEYLLKGKLTASFFKINKALGYDTTMSIKRTIYIDKLLKK